MYTIQLTDNEVGTLCWLTDRGYWPDEAYKGMHLCDNEPGDVENNVERMWQIEEHDVWSIGELAYNDEDAFLSCCAEPLLTKLIDLWQSIV